MNFLRAVYWGSKCEVKFGDMVSDSFGVVNGLRQGCGLSTVPFSLYINSLVSKLRTAEVSVKCRDQLIPALLYADQNVAEYEYLGCIINEYAECRAMVNYRAKAGARAL